MVKTIQIAKKCPKKVWNVHLTDMHKRCGGIERLQKPSILTCMCCFFGLVRRGVQFAYVLNPFVPQRYNQINVFCSGQYRTSSECLL